MSAFSPYLALATLPLSGFLGFNLNPVQFIWSFRHGLEPMPNEVRERAIAAHPVCAFLADGLMVVALGIVMAKSSVTLARVGFQLRDWERNAALGVAAAGVLFGLQRIMTGLVRVEAGSFVEVAKKRPVSISVGMFLAAAFSEELWVALCLVTLTATGHSTITSVAITSIVFAIAHYEAALGGAFAMALKGSISALLFVCTGSLIATFSWHFLGNLGSLYNARRVDSPQLPRAASG